MTSTPIRLVDSHCHLNYKGLIEDLPGVADRAAARGVGAMLAINARLSEYGQIVGIAEEMPQIFASAGSHPHYAETETDVAPETLVGLTEHPRVIGIGETGLDYYYDNAPRQMQRANFAAHIEAATETGLPIIVHMRDAEPDGYALLKEGAAGGNLRGVIHCFTASRDFAEKALDLGFYISFSGILTFKNAENIRDVARIVPADRMLVETDSPYLSPEPHRGKPCEPAFVADTAGRLAEVRETTPDDIAETTTRNFFTLFDKAARSAPDLFPDLISDVRNAS